MYGNCPLSAVDPPTIRPCQLSVANASEADDKLMNQSFFINSYQIILLSYFHFHRKTIQNNSSLIRDGTSCWRVKKTLMGLAIKDQLIYFSENDIILSSKCTIDFQEPNLCQSNDSKTW